MWLCDYVTMWLCNYVTMWLCNYVTMWHYVTMWLCNYVTIWHYVTMWLCNYVALCNYVCNYVALCNYVGTYRLCNYVALTDYVFISIPLPVATSSCSDCTSKVYEAKSKVFCNTKEQPTPVEGTVKGNKHKHHLVSMTQITWPLPCPGCVPAWLSGRLLRNGPGMFEIGDTKYNHWFDGQALLHSFTIVNG